jgi:hypothetical protein
MGPLKLTLKELNDWPLEMMIFGPFGIGTLVTPVAVKGSPDLAALLDLVYPIEDIGWRAVEYVAPAMS